MEWPEPVERVAAYMRAAGAQGRIEEFADGTPTARDAARAIGCDLAQIVKSLVIQCDARAIVVLVPGDRRADVERIAAHAGCRAARVATADEVETATGFPPGGVAPFPLPRVDRVLIERTLLAEEKLWAGAGSPRHMVGLEPAELVRLARAVAVHAVED